MGGGSLSVTYGKKGGGKGKKSHILCWRNLWTAPKLSCRNPAIFRYEHFEF